LWNSLTKFQIYALFFACTDLINLKLQYSTFVVSLDQHFIDNNIIWIFNKLKDVCVTFLNPFWRLCISRYVGQRELSTYYFRTVFTFRHTQRVPKFVNKFNHMSSCLPRNEKGILMNTSKDCWLSYIRLQLKYDRVGHFILLLRRNVEMLQCCCYYYS
jgi:hypothetical protein